ncbi:MAG: MFS transporter, partial [Candidatus Brocadia sp.]
LTPLGLIFSLLGGGLVTGSVLTGKYGNRVKRNILYTGSVWTLASGMIVFSLVPSYTAASCTVFFVGIAGGAFLSPINADIQKITPDELRGRSFACKDIFANATMVAPIPMIGKLTTFVSARELMLYLGIGGFLAGILVAWKSIKLNTIQELAGNDA